MNFAALDAYLERERVRAATSFALDEELGTHHGISSSDFLLLQSLQDRAESSHASAPLGAACCAKRARQPQRCARDAAQMHDGELEFDKFSVGGR